MQPVSRRKACALLLGGAATSLIAACQAVPTSTPTVSNPLVKPRASGAELTAVQATSELALGRNRFAVGLIDARNQPISAGTVRVELLKVNGTAAEKRSESTAQFRSVGGQAKGIWVASVEFNEVGPWGAQVTLDHPPDTVKVARMSLQVRQAFSAPGYGDPAVRTKSLMAKDAGGDLSHICSHTPACGLHEVSIDEALVAARTPLVIAFATPAFCTSATCGPQLDAVLQMQQSYASQATFIHVEIYQYPFEKLQPVAAVDAWQLPSEPWTFIVDRAGIVRDRFEGVAPADEMEPSLKAVL